MVDESDAIIEGTSSILSGDVCTATSDVGVVTVVVAVDLTDGRPEVTEALGVDVAEGTASGSRLACARELDRGVGVRLPGRDVRAVFVSR